MAGADVRTASSAREAISAWELEPGDALLCDLAMPDMDGFQVLNRIRGLDAAAGRETAAIALTAYTSEEYRVRCLAAGFHAHVGKPYKLDDLSIALGSALAQVRARPGAHARPSAQRVFGEPSHAHDRSSARRASTGEARRGRPARAPPVWRCCCFTRGESPTHRIGRATP